MGDAKARVGDDERSLGHFAHCTHNTRDRKRVGMIPGRWEFGLLDFYLPSLDL